MKLFMAINRFAGTNPHLDGLAKIAASYMPLVFLGWLLFLWFSRGKRNREIVLYSMVAVVLGLLLNFVITKVYYHPRPFMIPVGKLLIPHGPETSFPSDHTTFMLSIAIILLYFKESRIAGGVLFLLGLAGGFARVFCGLHFPLDIVGSFGVALIATGLVYLLRHALAIINNNILRRYDALSHRLGKVLHLSDCSSVAERRE